MSVQYTIFVFNAIDFNNMMLLINNLLADMYLVVLHIVDY
jgi:hypothetical protein